jgi:HAMP domain-containing protein
MSLCDRLKTRFIIETPGMLALRGYSMSLLIRINLALGAVFIAAALIAGYACRSILEANAQREVFVEAGLMMDSALAIRAYTANEILPLLSERIQEAFPPQSVPSYAATQNFLRLHERHPEYTYKEATLNPTNPGDRPADWEADIIQRFRNDVHAQEVIGERDTPMGKSLYLARPIRNGAECSACHSTPSAAPRTLIARYGSNNGFGWQPGEIVGAQVVSVPTASAAANADRAFRAFMTSLVTVFAAVFLVVNAVLYYMVLRPVRQIARVADRLSMGDMSAEDFPHGGAAEIASVARSFDRMRKSLEKALRLLEK